MGVDKWECNSGTETVYCSGRIGPVDCSDLWFPNELDNFDLVEFEGGTYLCDPFGANCVQYGGGPPPKAIGAGDIWCEGTSCTVYDPGDYFELVEGSSTFLCQRQLIGYDHYDCNQWFGGSQLPWFGVDPELYCSGNELLPECSELWYPDELDGYTILSDSLSSYLCSKTFTTRHTDYDCGRYSGGDPRRVFGSDLKCSDTLSGLRCDADDYPSFLDDVFFVSIEYGQYACESTPQGSECWRYNGGSVESAMGGSPDYYCNRFDECDRLWYP